MTSLDYDLVVVGGGAAGLGAASTAARAGARTLLVSDGPPGGDCTFTGCVPSKTLIESAKQGLAWDAAAQRVRDAVARIAATEDPAALRRTGIDVRLGRARFTNPGRLDADGRQVTAARFVVATGARPAIPPIPGLAGVPYLTN
jgi:pyruvate/2-oxoglutarate dehydrogenase complex dihydrolipoamide dehydrogenase (E3) component